MNWGIIAKLVQSGADHVLADTRCSHSHKVCRTICDWDQDF